MPLCFAAMHVRSHTLFAVLKIVMHLAQQCEQGLGVAEFARAIAAVLLDGKNRRAPMFRIVQGRFVWPACRVKVSLLSVRGETAC